MGLHGIPLPDGARARLQSGAPDLSVESLGGASGLEPGRPLRLLDPAGEVLATAVADPENGVVRVLAREELRAVDRGFLQERVVAALALRRSLGLPDEETDAFRLVNEAGDGLPGLSVDVYGAHAVLLVPSRGLLPLGRDLAQATLDAARAAGVSLRGGVIKVRAKEGAEKVAREETFGEPPPDRLVVKELGARYEVHLTGARNTGLFTDMREHRRALPPLVRGRRVLNAFCYTGAISVAAARAGAASVTSVDLASGVLDWARANFRLSGLDPEDARFRFETADVRRFLERARGAGERWDVIVLDPPTVSGARASQWAGKRDWADLVARAARALPDEGGVIWASANARSGVKLREQVVDGLRQARRRGALLASGGAAPDHPAPLEWPSERSLEVLLLGVR